MRVVCLDLEGVLIPEIWLALAARTSLPELEKTTRDEPDYAKLMHYRLDILKKNDLGLSDIQNIVSEMSPLNGAREFLDALGSQTQIAILSDTFIEFAMPLVAQLGRYFILCNQLVIRGNTIEDIQLRQKDGKAQAVRGFRSMGCQIHAAGDSFNDLTMLKTADKGVLFRSTPSIIEEYPEFPHCEDYETLLDHLFFD